MKVIVKRTNIDIIENAKKISESVNAIYVEYGNDKCWRFDKDQIQEIRILL